MLSRLSTCRYPWKHRHTNTLVHWFESKCTVAVKLYYLILFVLFCVSFYYSDLWAAQDCRIHLSHILLCEHCGGAVGRPHHLQNTQKLPFSAGHEVCGVRMYERKRCACIGETNKLTLFKNLKRLDTLFFWEHLYACLKTVIHTEEDF